MIHTNRIVTVGEQESIIDRPIVLYRGDREVEIEFTLVGNEFTFSEEGNVIKSVNASHGQLVLNTPSGEHMFSELAECHEGKVVFVVTKEMIDEFIEMGFYSFQIRLYDSAEMKSRVTIPPVLSGFDIRNPIAAEDETNVVDQGIVDYARIFKDQSNEELPTFDWQGNYNKTEWIHHDVITENKMNKIEDALYSINANIRESDVVMINTLDQVKYDADKYVKEHIAEVKQDVEDFERNLNTGVEKFKVDTNAAMTAHKNEVSGVVDGLSGDIKRINDVSIYAYISDYEKYVDETYDTERLQRAIDECSTKGKILVINENLNIHLKHGSTDACSIFIRSNLTMIGSGNCKIKLVEADNWCRMFNMLDIENVTIKNLYFDGNRYNVYDVEHQHIFFVCGCSRVLFDNCHFFEPRGDGIAIRKGTNNPYCHDIIVNNCIFESCGRNGFTFGSGYRYITITNSHFKGNTLAQHIDSEPDSSTLTEGINICNNFLDGTEGGGMFTVSTMGSKTDTEMFIIKDNIFLNTEFYLNGGYNCIIKNNTIKFTISKPLYSFPISIRGDIYNLTIENNVIDTRALIDASVAINGSDVNYEYPHNVRICNNTIYVAKSFAAFYNVTDLMVTNNTIISTTEDDSKHAIYIKTNSTSRTMNNVIIDNNIIKNFGIFLDFQGNSNCYSNNIRISNNSLYNIKSLGLYVVNNYLKNQVKNFFFYNNIPIDCPTGFSLIRNASGVYYKVLANAGFGDMLYCQNSPEGVYEAPIGSIAIDFKTGNMYLKQSDTSLNTGWVLK